MVVYVEPKKCSRCPTVQPGECFGRRATRKSGKAVWQAYCRPCRAEMGRERYAGLSEEEKERKRAKTRAHYRRTVSTAKGRAKVRRASRNRQRRRLATTRGREANRQSARRYRSRKIEEEGRAFLDHVARLARERRHRLKVEDPEAFAELLSRERDARRERMKRPGARQRQRENGRIAAALRREREGTPLDQQRKRAKPMRNSDPLLAVEPLVRYIEAQVAEEARLSTAAGADLDAGRAGSTPRERATVGVLGRAGIPERRWRAMRSGEQETIQFDTADRVATALGGVFLLQALWPELA